jgi:zinc protease
LHTANMIFGGTPNSRLMAELRQKRGLVYGAYSEIDPWAGSGLMTISLHVSPQWGQGMRTLVESMFRDYLRDGPTQQELDQYKRYLTNNSALTSASNKQILERLVEINRHHLPLDLDYAVQHVERLTLADLKQALNKHLAADKWRGVTVGKTVEQQPLPAPPDASTQTMCRADAGIVAS